MANDRDTLRPARLPIIEVAWLNRINIVAANYLVDEHDEKKNEVSYPCLTFEKKHWKMTQTPPLICQYIVAKEVHNITMRHLIAILVLLSTIGGANACSCPDGKILLYDMSN